jgi:hypothetical protein
LDDEVYHSLRSFLLPPGTSGYGYSTNRLDLRSWYQEYYIYPNNIENFCENTGSSYPKLAKVVIDQSICWRNGSAQDF